MAWSLPETSVRTISSSNSPQPSSSILKGGFLTAIDNQYSDEVYQLQISEDIAFDMTATGAPKTNFVSLWVRMMDVGCRRLCRTSLPPHPALYRRLLQRLS